MKRSSCKSALLIIDVQEDFCNGSLKVEGCKTIVPKINKLIKFFNDNHCPVIYTQDFHPQHHVSFKERGGPWPAHCVQGSHGAEFVPELIMSKNSIIVQKGQNLELDSYSGFFDNDHKSQTVLYKILQSKNINTVFIVGIATNFCVKYTALDAKSLGFETYVISEACIGVPDNIAGPENSDIKVKAEMVSKGIHLI